MLSSLDKINDRQLYKDKQITPTKRFSIKHPQPSPKQQQPTSQNTLQNNESSQQKYLGSNQVLKSNDFPGVFGKTIASNDSQKNSLSRQKSSSYFLKRMGITQRQLDKNYRKEYKSSAYSSSLHSPYSSYHQQNNYQINPILTAKQFESSTYHQNNGDKYCRNRDKFYDFLYKIIGILSCHTRLNMREVFKCLKANQSHNNYNYPEQTNIYDKGDEDNVFGEFQKVETKIDRLASVNIDIESIIDKDPNDDINGVKSDLHSLGINSQTKSDINSHNNKLSPKQKKQVFNFDQKTEKSYFNPDRNVEYGFDKLVKNGSGLFSDINKSSDKNKTVKRQKKQKSYQLSRNPHPQKFKQIQQQNLSPKNKKTINFVKQSEISESQKKLPKWLSIHINEQPINVSKQIQQNYSLALRQIYHLNPDTFKDSSPDFYQPIIPEIQFNGDEINTSLERQLINSKQPNPNASEDIIQQNNPNHEQIFDDYIENSNQVHSSNLYEQNVQQQSNQTSQITGMNLIHQSVQSNYNQFTNSRPISTFNEQNQNKQNLNQMENVLIRDCLNENNHDRKFSAINTQQQDKRYHLERNYSVSGIRPKSLTINGIHRSPQSINFIKEKITTQQPTINIRPKSNMPSSNQYNQSNQQRIVNFDYQNTQRNHRNQYELNQRNCKPARVLSCENIKYTFNSPRSMQQKPTVKFMNQQSPNNHERANLKVTQQYGTINKQSNEFRNQSYHVPSNIQVKSVYPSAPQSHIEKKLPIYYGIPSPKSPTSSYMQAQQYPEKSMNRYNSYQISSNIQREQTSKPNTRLINFPRKNDSNLGNTARNSNQTSYLSPKSHYGMERKPNQRIHVFSAKSNHKD